MSSRFLAKTAIRVRVSGPNPTEAVSGNGSGFSVTDSSAMARVEFASLSKTGDLLVAPWTMAGIALAIIRKPSWNDRSEPLRNEGGRLLFMMKLSVQEEGDFGLYDPRRPLPKP
jgi:hypothetical protein